MIIKFFRKIPIPLYLFLFTLVIYIKSVSPSVYGGDSGDFLAAAITRGVPHPSGYPLYTILGILFTSLPGPLSIAWKFGLVSAVFSALSVTLMYYLVYELVKKRSLAIATSLTLAFTYPFWLYAEIVEVFALQSTLVLLIILMTLKYIHAQKTKYLYWLGFTTGLSLTNNLSIIIIFPPIVLTLIIANRKLLLDYKTLSRGLGAFLIGLTPYLYIPFAAKTFPAMNWGYAVNFKNFSDLVSRKYYSWGVTDTHERFNTEIINYRFGVFFDYFKNYVHQLIPFLAISGLIQLLRAKKYQILFLIASCFFIFGPFFTVYSGTYIKSFLSLATLEKFYITTLLFSFLLIPLGFEFYLDLLKKIKLKKMFIISFNRIILLIAFLIPLSLLITNYKRTDFSSVYLGDNLARDILENVPENSVLLLRNDSLSFNTIYYQKAYGLNKSVSIPGPNNGFEVLLKTFVDENAVTNYKIRNQGTLDRDNLNASIAPLMKEHDVFIDGFYTLTDSKYGKIVTVPYGLFYKFEFYNNLPYPKEIYVRDVSNIISSYQIDDFGTYENITQYSLILADIKKLYSVGLLNVANYLNEQYQEDELAKYYLQKSTEIDPIPLSVTTN